MDLGVHCPSRKMQPETRQQRHAVSEYTKAPDHVVIEMQRALMLGPVIFAFPTLLYDWGLLPGVAIIFISGWVHTFIAMRFLEVPNLIKNGNMETCCDVAREVFGCEAMRQASRLIVILSWGAFTLLNLYSSFRYWIEVFSITTHWGEIAMEWFLTCVCCFVAARRQPLGNLRRLTKFALMAMYSACGIFLVSSVFHSLWHWHGIQILWREPMGAPQVQKLGLDMGSLAIAYAGICFLPYMVAEMATPQRAQNLFRQWYQRFGMLNLLFALIAHLAWGHTAESWGRLTENEAIALILDKTIKVLLGFRSMAILPLLVWPWVREVDSWMSLHTTPEVMLGLPWAIHRARRLQQVLPSLLVISIVLLDRIVGSRPLVSSCAALSLLASQMLLTPLICACAVRIYYRSLDHGCESESASRAPLAQTFQSEAPVGQTRSQDSVKNTSTLVMPAGQGGRCHQHCAVTCVCLFTLVWGAFVLSCQCLRVTRKVSVLIDTAFHTDFGSMIVPPVQRSFSEDIGL